MGRRYFRHLFRSPFRHDLSTGRSSFRSEVDHPIGALDHIQIVLDHHDGIAAVHQLLQHRQELLDVLDMQPGGGLAHGPSRFDR